MTPPLDPTPVVSVSEASEATGVPVATIHRYADRGILLPTVARGIRQDHYPQRWLPVLTTLRIMELVDCTPDQMRAIGATLTDRITAAGTDEEQHRLTRRLRAFQTRLVENGPHAPELSNLTGRPRPPSSTSPRPAGWS